MERKRRDGHPLLRGGRRQGSYTHGFSPSEMQSLSSICGAFIPSIPTQHRHFNSHGDDANCKAVQDFYLASGSQPPVPDEAAELIRKRSQPDAVALIRVVLWLLSTGLGTLILCGRACVVGKFPFITKFSDLGVEKREQILKRWSTQKSILPLRLVFVLLKVFCLYTFTSMTSVLIDPKSRYSNLNSGHLKGGRHWKN
ncbi:hypothetical protein ACLOJK_011406 [Asimina triloba]